MYISNNFGFKVPNFTSKISYGADYSELNNPNSNSKLTYRDAFIKSRIPEAIKDAEEFVEQYPQFELDDVIQGLILILVEMTAPLLKGRCMSDCYPEKKLEYFSELLNKDSEAQDEDFKYKSMYYTPYDSTCEQVELGDIQEQVRKIIGRWLSKRDAKVLKMNYGIGQKEYLSNSEISNKLYLTKDTVSRITYASVRKLGYIAKYANHKGGLFGYTPEDDNHYLDVDS